MHDAPSPPHPSDDLTQEWDGRYAAPEGHLWTGIVNDVVLAEVPGLAPGHALDVGCGEGADAVWLAREGWTVTGLDVSEVALGRARAAAAEAGVDVTWLLADLADDPTGGTTFDLVSAQYPVLRQSEGDVEVRALLGAVAPGGTLLLAFHAGVDEEHARAHGFDPADFLWPPDLVARLDPGTWAIEVDATRPRVRDRGPDSPHVDDHVIRARRLA
jgi:SAM-dependent methyltransferase